MVKAEKIPQQTTSSDLCTENPRNVTISHKKDNTFPKRYDEQGGGGCPTVKCGADAELNHFRNFHTEPEIAVDKNNSTNQEEEYILFHSPSIKVSWSVDSQPDESFQNSGFQNIMGKLYVTSKRIFFVASSEKNSTYDFAIDAACISLHAMASEPQWNVYCQLTDDIQDICWNPRGDKDTTQETIIIETKNNKSPSPIEIYFTPVDTPEDKCQLLFKAMTKLATLNPVEDEDDDDYWRGNANTDNNSGNGLASMIGTMAGKGTIDNDNIYHDDDGDVIYRVDSSNITDHCETVENDRRQQMLNRLDNLLEVPSDSDVETNSGASRKRPLKVDRSVDGQFDDAEEDHEEGTTKTNSKLTSNATSSKTKKKSTNDKKSKFDDEGQFDDAEGDLL